MILSMILSLLEQKSSESVFTFITVRIYEVMACWLFVMIGVLIDFWSGRSTAKALGEKILSRGFRKTIEKFGDYFKVLLFALMFDTMGICFLHFYILPFGTLLATVSILCIEGRSVIENARRKRAHAGDIPDMVKKILQATTKEHATEIITTITETLTTNKS